MFDITLIIHEFVCTEETQGRKDVAAPSFCVVKSLSQAIQKLKCYGMAVTVLQDEPEFNIACTFL